MSMPFLSNVSGWYAVDVRGTSQFCDTKGKIADA